MTDASNTCAGAVLQQKIDQKWKPLSFFSCKFSEAQQRYSAYDREVLSIYMAVKHFKYMIEGQHVTIFRDHKPLVYALYKKATSGSDTPKRLQHLDFISQFCKSIEYIQRSQNIVADSLSRIEQIDMPSPIDYTKLSKAQQNDEELEYLLKSKNLNFKTIVYPNCSEPIYCEISKECARPYLPHDYRITAFKAIHGISHSGTRATRKMITNRYFWKSMNSDINEWTKACVNCQKSKIQPHTTSPLGSFPSCSRFEHLHVDIVGPLTYCQGISKIRTTAYHPQANGMIERWHRTLKTALMSRGNTRACLRDDTGISAAEMVYGTTLKLPGDFFESSKQASPDNETLLQDLLDRLKPAFPMHNDSEIQYAPPNKGEEFITNSREHSNCSEEHGNNNNLIRTRYGRLIKPTMGKPQSKEEIIISQNGQANQADTSTLHEITQIKPYSHANHHDCHHCHLLDMLEILQTRVHQVPEKRNPGVTR
nr:uncharacterized protein LOC116766377 [Danaus plexippus plexippus]